jgi:hypothetical protein
MSKTELWYKHTWMLKNVLDTIMNYGSIYKETWDGGFVYHIFFKNGYDELEIDITKEQYDFLSKLYPEKIDK